MRRAGPQWGTAFVLYAALRRALGKAAKPNASSRALLWKVALIFLMMPCIGPTLWRAALAMPPELVWFVAVAVVLRIFRWLWRKGYFRR